jgi:hypothetical protein
MPPSIVRDPGYFVESLQERYHRTFQLHSEPTSAHVDWRAWQWKVLQHEERLFAKDGKEHVRKVRTHHGSGLCNGLGASSSLAFLPG